MRSGQQNKRSRGRGNNNGFNRKGANPLTRTYDSSGPDVKVRGTAQHIAEKYMSLARDAQGSGDRVMAENYLQHAEHYNRIIAAAQAQMQERYQQRDDRSDNNSDDNDDNTAGKNNNQQNNQDSRNSKRDNAPKKQDQSVDADGPQPEIEGTPAEVAAEASDGQPVEKPRRSRRTSTTPRPRRTKRASAEGGAEDAPAEAAATNEDAGPVASDDQPAEPAPKKPVRRKRTPKAEAKEQSETDAKSEPALADAPGE